MTHASAMLASHPDVRGNVNDALVRCIEACLDCAQACTSCADACIGEADVAGLRQCIRANLDCADVCAATASIATRRTGSDERVVNAILGPCAEACKVCGDECERHAGHHEHCRVCAEACRICEQACREAAVTVHRAAH